MASKPRQPEDIEVMGTAEPSENGAEASVDINAVLVHVIREDDGGVRTHIEVIGDARVTEVDTLLALARKGWQERIGISE